MVLCWVGMRRLAYTLYVVQQTLQYGKTLGAKGIRVSASRYSTLPHRCLAGVVLLVV